MVLELLGGSKPAKVPELIAKKKYDEALTLLKEQLRKSPGDTSLRMQTADVLVLQGKIDNAIRMLEALADDYATEGFAAKAIAVLKKIQKLDPTRKGLEAKIVELLKATGPARKAAPPSAASYEPSPLFEFGMVADEEPVVDIGAVIERSPVPERAASSAADALERSAAAELSAALERPAAPPPPPKAPAPIPVVMPAEPEPEISIGEDVGVGDIAITTEAAEAEEGRQRVVSPLFDDFAEDELLEVIMGLELLTYEPGDILVTEGEKGDSLYVLTSGSAKAFVRNKEGGSTQVRQLNEGDFFGEISILTGKPRTATITAAAACELLRLDRTTLDSITAKRPRVQLVLQQFYEERAHNAAEAEIRGGLDAAPSETLRQAGLVGEDEGPAPKEAAGAPPSTERIVITEDDLQGDPTEVRLQHLKKVAIEQSRKQNWADAVQAWQQYIALKPADTEAGNVLGVLFGKLGRWKEAAQAFENLVELKSQDPTVFFNLGLCYRQLDLLTQAAQAYRRALTLKPDYDKAKQALASVQGKIKGRAEAQS